MEQDFGGWELVMGEPVYGLRIWEANEQSGHLEAWAQDTGWAAGVNTARCVGRGHWAHRDEPSPVQDCTCGFYSYYAGDDAEDGHFRYAWDEPTGDGFDFVVAGVVKNSGKIVMGTKGMRSQFAEIEALCLTPAPSGEVKKRLPWHSRHLVWGGVDMLAVGLVAWLTLVVSPGFFGLLCGVVFAATFNHAFVTEAQRIWRSGCQYPALHAGKSCGCFLACNFRRRRVYRIWEAGTPNKLQRCHQRIRDLYPEAKVFTDRDEMLEAYAEQLKGTKLTAECGGTKG